MLCSKQIRLLGLDACQRLLFGGDSGMELTEGTRIHDGNRDLRRASLRASRIEVCLRVFQLGGVVSGIEFDEQGPGLDELVVLHSRIDPGDSSADARAYQIEVTLNLSVVGRFVILRMQPPQRSA